MERLTNADHKEMGLYAYCGEKNPYEIPLTIGELAGFPEAKYSPREILEEVFARLAAYEDTGMEPEDVSAQFDLLRKYSEAADGIGVKRLRELAQAEKDGRLVVLPCKVGDKLWYIFDGMPYQSTVHEISVSPAGELAIRFGGWPADVIWASNIGKTVFLTRQEAEEAMREEGSS